jgi:hypothetical protein
MDTSQLAPMPAKLEASEQTPFSREIPNLQIVWDSTSLGWLKSCPRYYYYRMLHGKETKMASIHLTFGLLYHGALEIYDQARARGEDHDTGQRVAVDYALCQSVAYYQAWRCANCQRVWAAHHDHCKACGDDATSLFTYWRDRLTELPNKGRQQLVRAVVWYTEQFQNDALETVQLDNGEAAVEVTFKVPLDFGPSGSSEYYTLSGHLDRLATSEEGTYVADRKTTGSTLYANYFDRFSPDGQVTQYTIAGQVISRRPLQGVIIDAAQLMVNGVRFQRGYIHRTESQLEEWLDDFQEWTAAAERYARQGKWPMNEKSCSLYGGCPFRAVCGRAPEVRDKYLENDFVTAEWNPARSR